MVKNVSCQRSRKGRSEEYFVTNHGRTCEGGIFRNILWQHQEGMPTHEG